jgi:hypothetical protein
LLLRRFLPDDLTEKHKNSLTPALP